MKPTRGFSLIELLIALVIVGILSGVAYPTYQHVIYQSRRLEAKTALLQLAADMTAYHLAHNSYRGATFVTLGASNQSEQGDYQLHIEHTDDKHYVLLASPTFNDTACGQFALDDRGEKSASGTQASCWLA